MEKKHRISRRNIYNNQKISYHLSYLNSEKENKILNEIDEISRMIMGLIKKLNTND